MIPGTIIGNIQIGPGGIPMQIQQEVPEVEKTVTPFEYFNQLKNDRKKQREINEEKAGGIPAIDPTNPDEQLRDEIAE